MELFSSWTGSDFLLFYSVLLGLATAAAWSIPAILREPGRRGDAQDLESMALLVGGRARLADSLLADLFVRGGLAAVGKDKVEVVDPGLVATPGGQALLAIREPMTPAEARRVIDGHAERVAARLQRSGLMLRGEDFARLRWASIAPFGALFLIGLYRQRAGAALGEPTEFLVILLVLTLVLAIIRFARSDPRTATGIAAVREQCARSSRLARAPRSEEAAMAVALFGTGVLIGTPWEPLHAMRSSGDGGSSDSSGSSDGGSGCGGGCGGCGG